MARILTAALAALLPLTGTLSALGPAPASAESHAEAVTPEARADMHGKALIMQAQLVAIVADLDAEIARQEDGAGFGASEDLLAKIDNLKTHREGFATQLERVRALITELDGTR